MARTIPYHTIAWCSGALIHIQSITLLLPPTPSFFLPLSSPSSSSSFLDSLHFPRVPDFVSVDANRHNRNSLPCGINLCQKPAYLSFYPRYVQLSQLEPFFIVSRNGSDGSGSFGKFLYPAVPVSTVASFGNNASSVYTISL